MDTKQESNRQTEKFQISGHLKGPRPSTNTTSMYEKGTTHVTRTYSQTYRFIYIDSRTDIPHYYWVFFYSCQK